jgi:hypothetical protein
MKGALLNYFRFGRGMIVGTEVSVSGGIADILATNKMKFYEVEIKISISDLKADFKNKKHKHYYMKNPNSINIFQPNYFYFAIPYGLKEKAIPLIPKLYGIIIVHNFHGVYIERRAKLLHSNYCNRLFDKLVKRISSELANWYDYEKHEENL